MCAYFYALCPSNYSYVVTKMIGVSSLLAEVADKELAVSTLWIVALLAGLWKGWEMN